MLDDNKIISSIKSPNVLMYGEFFTILKRAIFAGEL